ncbi:MAG: hypothetical protein OFPI_16090 [Osedax symbiont Rs2]|nr:MAG: hypothetical protein OFPI_16090 [Osedax symbiont Rs2]
MSLLLLDKVVFWPLIWNIGFLIVGRCCKMRPKIMIKLWLLD